MLYIQSYKIFVNIYIRKFINRGIAKWFIFNVYSFYLILFMLPI